MLVVTKRVDTVNVRVHINVNEFESRVSGHAFPFGKQFHSVSFSAIREADFSSPQVKIKDAVPEIGFGGNQFQGEKAARVLKAAQVAYDQAVYYTDLVNDIANGGYSEVLQCAINQGDADYVIDCLLLTPAEQQDDDRGLLIALRDLIKDASLLGSTGSLTPDNFEALERVSQNGFYGMMKACALTTRYDAEPDPNKKERIEATQRLIGYIRDAFSLDAEEA